MKYLNSDGVKYLWSKIKNAFIMKTAALTYEEIQASTDLTGKVLSAKGATQINPSYSFNIGPGDTGTILVNGYKRTPFLVITSGTENASLYLSLWVAAIGELNPKATSISNAYNSVSVQLSKDKLTITNTSNYRQTIVVTIIGRLLDL